MSKTKTKPKRELPLKAFVVNYDAEGYSDIVWATCGAAARRQMMGEFDAEFGELTTKRRPELDNFEGDVERYKFDNGWWSAYCQYHECRKEHICKDDGAVLVGKSWFCCQEHADLEHQRLDAQRKVIDAAKGRVSTKYPGIQISNCYLNVRGDVVMSVTMPSGATHHTFDSFLLSDECQLA